MTFLKRYLVNQGCIKPLCDLLVCPDPRIVTVCLEGLENILKVGEVEKENSGGTNLYAQYIDDAEGLEKIENLQSHDNNEIYEKAVKILETYWLEDEEDSQNLASTGDAAQTDLSFGANQPTVPPDYLNVLVHYDNFLLAFSHSLELTDYHFQVKCPLTSYSASCACASEQSSHRTGLPFSCGNATISLLPSVASDS
eukprot:Gb_02102 [translate_table: standard]